MKKMPVKIGPTPGGPKMPPKLRLKLANECQDLLARTKLKPSKEYKFYVIHSKDATNIIFNKLMTLFESLMRDMYEKSSWGWNEEEKLAEWRHSRTRLVIVTKNPSPADPFQNITYGDLPDEDEDIIGFMNFRYEVGSDKNECALYVYELHIDVAFQRQGLGKELMGMARVLASQFKMDKIMLTVFRTNTPALKFYSKLNFSPDKSSPTKDEADYTILSSKVKFS